MARPTDYDPLLTEHLLEEGDKLLDESRRLLAVIDLRLEDESD